MMNNRTKKLSATYPSNTPKAFRVMHVLLSLVRPWRRFWEETERELMMSRENLEFALQAGRMGTWDIDLATHALSCSKEMLDLWNVSPEEFTGDRSILQAKVHPDDVDRMKNTIDFAIRTGGVYEMEFRIRPDAVSERWVLSRGRCLLDPRTQMPVRFSGVVYDTSETKRIQQELKQSKEIAERANLVKTQFLANMSHEIRTPIAAIIGFAELLRAGGNSASDQLRFMNIIERNSQNLLRLIDDILDISKVEAGKITIEKREFNFAEFLADFVSVMKSKASQKNIAFSLRVDGLIPEKIITDQLRFRQILANLVGNAIKFTDRGSVELSLQYQASQLKFTVRDTGPGIPPEKIAELFQVFGQADPSMDRKHGGAGLGLILARRLSAALGGEVVLAKSEVGVGSTFTGSIRMEAVSGASMISNEDLSVLRHEKKPVRLANEQLNGLSVLVVDDSLDNQALIATYLRQMGAMVAVADDGLSGLNRAIEMVPDVVLMDIQMPVMDGHMATRELRSAGFSKPIIALTAHAMREDRERCFESGCTDYLTKPVQMETLARVLSRYCQYQLCGEL